MGTLLAIFIATSDEALAILAIHPNLWKVLVILIVGKIVLGTLVGLIVDHLDHKNKDDYEYLQIAPCDCGCQAVSYTHLDVYKRQVITVMHGHMKAVKNNGLLKEVKVHQVKELVNMKLVWIKVSFYQMDKMLKH